jgi:hypothetical protein
MGDAAAGRLLASDHNLEFVDLDRYNVDTSAARLLPVTVARRHHVVPIGRKFGAPVVAITDPTDVVALDTLRATMGREFVTVVAADDQIEACLDRVYRADPPSATTGSAPAGVSNVTTKSAANGAGTTSIPRPPTAEFSDVGLAPAETPPGALDLTPPAVWEAPLDTVFDIAPVPPLPPPVAPYPGADERSSAEENNPDSILPRTDPVSRRWPVSSSRAVEWT